MVNVDDANRANSRQERNLGESTECMFPDQDGNFVGSRLEEDAPADVAWYQAKDARSSGDHRKNLEIFFVHTANCSQGESIDDVKRSTLS